MATPSEKPDYTPESTVHLWTVPRKNKGKRTKTEIVQNIYQISPLLKVELQPLSLDDLERLETAISVEIDSPTPTGKKAELVEFLKPLGLKDAGKLPVPSLKALCSYVTRNYVY